jgi:hypothetical protein
VQTTVRLRGGLEITEAGTDILKRFAILDDQRRLREDVASVQVDTPHPFLQLGVELLDLPGTNDQASQQALVKDQLLTADLIVQVLDARQLMTLREREALRDWLQDRGINTVLFVVNFINLLAPDEQRDITHRMRFVAESFRSALPAGLSNLYRVDALPALQAKLKGDLNDLQASGLPQLELALRSLVQTHQAQLPQVWIPRLQLLVDQAKQALHLQIHKITLESEKAQENRSKKIELKQKAQKLIGQGYQASVKDLRQWLDPSALLSRYQGAAAAAIQSLDFKDWETYTFKPAWLEQQKAVVDWVDKACDFFELPKPVALSVAFPAEPIVDAPAPAAAKSGSILEEVAPVAFAGGLGFLLGGPIGAAVMGGASYLLNQPDSSRSTPDASPSLADWMDQAYERAAKDYLTSFSTSALAALQKYEVLAEKIIFTTFDQDIAQSSGETQRLQFLREAIRELDRSVSSLQVG